MSTRAYSGQFDPALAVDVLVSPGLVEAAGRLLAEDPAAVEKALRGAVTALLSGLAGHATDKVTVTKVTRVIAAGAGLNAADLAADRTSAVEQIRLGAEMVRDIFGARARRVIDAIAQHSNLPASAAAVALNLSAPLVVEMVRGLAADANPSSSLEVLGSQQKAISSLVPPEISTMAGLGGGLLAIGSTRQVSAPPVPPPPASTFASTDSPRRLWRYGVLGLCLLAAAAGTFLMLRHRGSNTALALATVTLPDRTVVEVPAGGFHRGLISYLGSSGAKELPKSFFCDHIEFYADSSRLKPNSMDAVDALAAILKAYPSVTVRLDGYVWPKGDPDTRARVALDQSRAVRARLVANRVEEERIEAGSYSAPAPPAGTDGGLRLVVTAIQ